MDERRGDHLPEPPTSKRSTSLRRQAEKTLREEWKEKGRNGSAAQEAPEKHCPG